MLRLDGSKAGEMIPCAPLNSSPRGFATPRCGRSFAVLVRLRTAKEVARVLAISDKTVSEPRIERPDPLLPTQSSVRFRARDLGPGPSRQQYPGA